MLSERAQQMARLMVFEGMSQTDAYRASGYKGKDPSNAANNITRKDDFQRHLGELRDKITNEQVKSKVFTYEQILEKVQDARPLPGSYSLTRRSRSGRPLKRPATQAE